MRARFYWPALEFLEKNCTRCIQRKTPIKPNANLVNIISNQPMELVCLDFLSLERSKGGQEHILVITDYFTRYAKLFPPEISLQNDCKGPL